MMRRRGIGVRLLLSHIRRRIGRRHPAPIVSERWVRELLLMRSIIGLEWITSMHPRNRLPSRWWLMERQSIVGHGGLLQLHACHVS